jgi:hypothetical protein
MSEQTYTLDQVKAWLEEGGAIGTGAQLIDDSAFGLAQFVHDREREEQEPPIARLEAWRVECDKNGWVEIHTPTLLVSISAAVGVGSNGWTCVGFAEDDDERDLALEGEIWMSNFPAWLDDGKLVVAAWAIMAKEGE